MLIVAIAFEWMDLPTDHSKCRGCEQIIFGTMHVLCLFIDNVKAEGEAKYCDDCYFGEE